MTTGSILLAVALLLVVGLYVLRPFLLTRNLGARQLTDREAMVSQKEVLLHEIRDLEFDHQTDKVSDADYMLRRTRLLHAAADLARRIDHLPPQAAQSVDDQIEAAIARLRDLPVAPEFDASVAAATGASVPGATAASGVAAAKGFCPSCGQPREAGDQFCAYCGKALT